jgi:hypothetical protein
VEVWKGCCGFAVKCFGAIINASNSESYKSAASGVH